MVYWEKQKSLHDYGLSQLNARFFWTLVTISFFKNCLTFQWQIVFLSVFYTIKLQKLDRQWKNQAIFEEKYSAVDILLMASRESRKTFH